MVGAATVEVVGKVAHREPLGFNLNRHTDTRLEGHVEDVKTTLPFCVPGLR